MKDHIFMKDRRSSNASADRRQNGDRRQVVRREGSPSDTNKVWLENAFYTHLIGQSATIRTDALKGEQIYADRAHQQTLRSKTMR